MKRSVNNDVKKHVKNGARRRGARGPTGFFTLFFTPLFTLLFTPLLLSSQTQRRMTPRVFLRSVAVCDAEGVRTYSYDRHLIGDTVFTDESKPGRSGRTLYRDMVQRPGCWFDGSNTIPLDVAHPEITMAAIVDSLLARKFEFEEGVSMLNKLEARRVWEPASKAPFERYPLLAFKRLQVVDRVAALLDGHRSRTKPFEMAFVVAHQELLNFNEPSGDWRVPGSHFFKVADGNKTESWADDAAWVGATQPPGGDECPSSCWIAMIGMQWAEYWKRFPQGRRVAESFVAATEMARTATSIAGDEPPKKKEVADLRASVPPSKLPERAKLLEAIAALERVAKPD